MTKLCILLGDISILPYLTVIEIALIGMFTDAIVCLVRNLVLVLVPVPPSGLLRQSDSSLHVPYISRL